MQVLSHAFSTLCQCLTPDTVSCSFVPDTSRMMHDTCRVFYAGHSSRVFSLGFAHPLLLSFVSCLFNSIPISTRSVHGPEITLLTQETLYF